MAEHIYDKDGNYVGKQLSDKEHESYQRKRYFEGQAALDEWRKGRKGREEQRRRNRWTERKNGCGCLLIIAAFLISLLIIAGFFLDSDPS